MSCRPCVPVALLNPPVLGEPVCRLCGSAIVLTEGEWVPVQAFRYNAIGRPVEARTVAGLDVSGELIAWDSHSATVRDFDGRRVFVFECDPASVVVS